MAKMIQIRNVPDDLHTKLKVRAAQTGMSLSEYLLTEVEKIAEVPTVAELAERIRKGESWESLAAQHVPEGQRDRAQVHEFRGAAMEIEDERKVLTLPPGEVVGPLRIEGGYSVFQGVAQVRSGRIPFYEAREKIKTYLETRRVEEARQQLVANLQRQRPVQRFASDKTLAAVH
jgi:plasmid stability protein